MCRGTPRPTWSRSSKGRSLGTYGGLAGYREDSPPSPSMTAEAMFCKQMLGMRRDNAASREAAEYLLARLPTRTTFNEYYWYYGTLAMYQYGGEGWRDWNGAIRDLLTSEQRTDGDFAGSWDPLGPWAPIRRPHLFHRVEHALSGSVLSLPAPLSNGGRSGRGETRMTKARMTNE